MKSARRRHRVTRRAAAHRSRRRPRARSTLPLGALEPPRPLPSGSPAGRRASTCTRAGQSTTRATCVSLVDPTFPSASPNLGASGSHRPARRCSPCPPGAVAAVRRDPLPLALVIAPARRRGRTRGRARVEHEIAGHGAPEIERAELHEDAARVVRTAATVEHRAARVVRRVGKSNACFSRLDVGPASHEPLDRRAGRGAGQGRRRAREGRFCPVFAARTDNYGLASSEWVRRRRGRGRSAFG